MSAADDRRAQIIDVLEDAFAELMHADPRAFRTKFRKMAADPFAFYRGSACLFYADMAQARDRRRDHRADDRTSRVWIHGDLHAENFGTYMNSEGVLVFDVNDFDEAYLGHFTWDLMRFSASLALTCWQKALPEEEVRRLVARFARAYLQQINHYLRTEDDTDFALHLDTASGPVLEALEDARKIRRADVLDVTTSVHHGVRKFHDDPTVRRLSKREHAQVMAAFESYLETIPDDKRFDRALFYDVRDIVGKSGFGI